MAERKRQVFVDELMSEQLSCSCDGFGGQRARSQSTLYLQISRQQFGADSSIIRKFIALRVEMVRFSCGQPLILL